jgi:hypothetical protein
MRLAALPILAALLAPMPAAAAGLIDATNPERIALRMIALGYPAAMDIDGAGDPLIRSSAAGANFTVFFYGCTNGANCLAVQFQAGFNLPTPTNAAKMNGWNRAHRFGAAYIDDEGDPMLQMDVTLDGGVSEANFDDAIDWWKVVLTEFQEYIEW